MTWAQLVTLLDAQAAIVRARQQQARKPQGEQGGARDFMALARLANRSKPAG